MDFTRRLLKSVAFFLKPLNLPHLIKYIFFLLLKDHRIPVRSRIKISNAEMDLNLGDFIDYWIFMDGSYEGGWIKNIIPLVHGRVLIDIGANIGIYPLSLYKEASFIFAFEPEEENYERLLGNLSINSVQNVKAIKMALYSQNNKEAKLYTSKKNKGWNSLTIRYPGRIQKIRAVTLDYFVKRNKITNIGLIKIDVEGPELEVLKGGHNTLMKTRPPVLVEFNFERSRLSGYHMSEIYKLMKKYNYKAYALRDERLSRTKMSEIPVYYNDNILFK